MNHSNLDGTSLLLQNCRRKAATTASQNLSRKQASRLRRVSSILRKKNKLALSEEDAVFLKENVELVNQFYKRREKRVECQKRLAEKEDLPSELEEKCLELAQAIHDAEFLVVYTGAGISTSASIPDYRGPNGIWTRLRRGQDIGKHDLTSAKPTQTHMAVSHLYKKGIVRHVVSQNCDGLHLRSGLPKTALSELHGNMYIEVCKHCQPAREYVRIFDVTENTSTFKHKTGRRCYRCGEPLDDTIVHFGERGKLRWPLNWQGACQAAKACDTIVCLGSSLKVLRRYSWLWQMDRPAKRRPKLYIVNLQWTPKDKDATMKINGKCDDVMMLVMKYLGLEIPCYGKADDPIFRIYTPLHSEELCTFNQPVLTHPDADSDSEHFSDDRSNVSYNPPASDCVVTLSTSFSPSALDTMTFMLDGSLRASNSAGSVHNSSSACDTTCTTVTSCSVPLFSHCSIATSASAPAVSFAGEDTADGQFISGSAIEASSSMPHDRRFEVGDKNCINSVHSNVMNGVLLDVDSVSSPSVTENCQLPTITASAKVAVKHGYTLSIDDCPACSHSSTNIHVNSHAMVNLVSSSVVTCCKCGHELGVGSQNTKKIKLELPSEGEIKSESDIKEKFRVALKCESDIKVKCDSNIKRENDIKAQCARNSNVKRESDIALKCESDCTHKYENCFTLKSGNNLEHDKDINCIKLENDIHIKEERNVKCVDDGSTYNIVDMGEEALNCEVVNSNSNSTCKKTRFSDCFLLDVKASSNAEHEQICTGNRDRGVRECGKASKKITGERRFRRCSDKDRKVDGCRKVRDDMGMRRYRRMSGDYRGERTCRRLSDKDKRLDGCRRLSDTDLVNSGCTTVSETEIGENGCRTVSDTKSGEISCRMVCNKDRVNSCKLTNEKTNWKCKQNNLKLKDTIDFELKISSVDSVRPSNLASTLVDLEHSIDLDTTSNCLQNENVIEFSDDINNSLDEENEKSKENNVNTSDHTKNDLVTSVIGNQYKLNKGYSVDELDRRKMTNMNILQADSTTINDYEGRDSSFLGRVMQASSPSGDINSIGCITKSKKFISPHFNSVSENDPSSIKSCDIYSKVCCSDPKARLPHSNCCHIDKTSSNADSKLCNLDYISCCADSELCHSPKSCYSEVNCEMNSCNSKICSSEADNCYSERSELVSSQSDSKCHNAELILGLTEAESWQADTKTLDFLTCNSDSKLSSNLDFELNENCPNGCWNTQGNTLCNHLDVVCCRNIGIIDHDYITNDDNDSSVSIQDDIVCNTCDNVHNQSPRNDSNLACCGEIAVNSKEFDFYGTGLCIRSGKSLKEEEYFSLEEENCSDTSVQVDFIDRDPTEILEKINKKLGSRTLGKISSGRCLKPAIFETDVAHRMSCNIELSEASPVADNFQSICEMEDETGSIAAISADIPTVMTTDLAEGMASTIPLSRCSNDGDLNETVDALTEEKDSSILVGSIDVPEIGCRIPLSLISSTSPVHLNGDDQNSFLLHTDIINGVIHMTNCEVVPSIVDKNETVDGVSTYAKDLDGEEEEKGIWSHNFSVGNSTSDSKLLDDEVKRLWFWGFDSTPSEEQLPEKRVTRSSYQKSLRSLSPRLKKCNCVMENPQLCHKGQERLSGMIPEEGMRKVRETLKRRRVANYIKYEPVFDARLKSRVYRKTRKTRKRLPKYDYSDSGEDTEKTDRKKVEPSRHIEEGDIIKSTKMINREESGRKCKEISMNRKEYSAKEVSDRKRENASRNREKETSRNRYETGVNRNDKRPVPGWYGKGYRKIYKKRRNYTRHNDKL